MIWREISSSLEHIDLDRLQQDRNRCAHPSMLADDQAFIPSAELARLHIRSAVTHLLQHPPVQGKYALERLVLEVGSEYFPDNVKKATASLSSGPLKRPREALVRNFIVVLLKQVLAADTEWKLRWRTYAALGAVRSLHPAMFEAALQEKLTPLFRAVKDDNLSFVTLLLCKINDCWHQLDADVQHRIEIYAANLPASELDELGSLLDFSPLKIHAEKRLARTARKELLDTMFFALPSKVADKYIDTFLASKSFDEANEWGKQISMYASDFSDAQQRRIIQGIAENGQINGSFEVGRVISSLRQTNKLPSTEFESLLKNHGLKKFLLDEENGIQQ